MNGNLKIGCIGCGFIGSIHMQNALRMPGVSIHAVADTRESAARTFHHQFRSQYWTTDPLRVVEDPELDAIIICTYPPTHAQLAIQSAQAGKNILLEKPMATSSASCIDIMRAAKNAGVKLALNLKFRFSVAAQEVRQRIPSPVLISSQSCTERMEDDHYHMNPEFGGGIVENLGAHSLDLVCFLAGSEPIRVFAQGQRLPDRKKTVFDAVIGTLEFENGCLASFVISDCGHCAYSSKWFFQIADGERCAVIHNHCRSLIFGDSTQETVGESHTPAHEIGTSAVLKDFVCAIKENREPRVSGIPGLRIALITESIQQSILSGKPAPVQMAAVLKEI